MKVKKTIECGIIKLTNIKKEILTQEYENLQRFLNGEDVKLYSANKQQALRFYKKVKSDKEYPLSIRKDLIKIERNENKVAQYWARVPTANRKGGLWVAIKPHCDIPKDVEFCESKIKKHRDNYILNLIIQKEVHPNCSTTPNVVIAIDIGEANPITSVELWGSKAKNPQFLGNEVREIRSHYNNLKKEVGRKKIKHAIKWIKEKIAKNEKNKVNDVLHKATTFLIRRAIELKNQGFSPVIALGNLEKVRKPRIKGKTRCKKNNRKIHTMPSYKVKNMLTYKALWEEIPVVAMNEAYTSKMCWRCNSLKTIVKKRLFNCLDCGLEYNRDLNGAINIGNRLLDQLV